MAFEAARYLKEQDPGARIQNFDEVALGYSLEEIRGEHHRIFCESSYADSPEYRRFWDNLAGIYGTSVQAELIDSINKYLSSESKM